MLTERNIKAFSIFAGVLFAALMGLLFHIPGLLLGSILAVFGSLMLNERLQALLPENQRRIRRMMRHEGLG